MPTATTAAVAACAFIALLAAHYPADHIVQTPGDAAHKGAPDRSQLAAGVHPWTGWAACARHVATYTGTQAGVLFLATFVAPITTPGALAALAVSASSHAVIDRRWLVRAIVDARGCHNWREAPYLIDQSLHIFAMAIAAGLAAVVTGPACAVLVGVASAALVAAGMAAERVHAWHRRALAAH